MVAVPLTLSVTDVVVVEGPVKVNVKDPLVLGSEAELPAEIDTLGFEVPSLLFESLSFEQLIALKKLVGPFFLKNFVLDAEKIFGNIRQYEINVQMTDIQRLVYHFIYEKFNSLVSQIARGEEVIDN